MKQDNTDVKKLSREQLEAEYERSQWTLAALLKRFGPQSLHPNDLDALPAQVRVWYSEQEDGSYLIHLRPHCSNLEQASQPATKDNTND